MLKSKYSFWEEKFKIHNFYKNVNFENVTTCLLVRLIKEIIMKMKLT